jgi:hypothetical protein
VTGSPPHVPRGSPTPWVSPHDLLPHPQPYSCPETLAGLKKTAHIPRWRGEAEVVPAGTVCGLKGRCKVSKLAVRWFKMKYTPFDASERVCWGKREVGRVREADSTVTVTLIPIFKLRSRVISRLRARNPSNLLSSEGTNVKYSAILRLTSYIR